jgi:hypothetical protein
MARLAGSYLFLTGLPGYPSGLSTHPTEDQINVKNPRAILNAFIIMSINNLYLNVNLLIYSSKLGGELFHLVFGIEKTG